MVQNRQTATKQHIREALIQLLLEEKFETISVSKLCQRAGINRGTFYLHYLDKFDLIETLKEEIIIQLRKNFEETTNTRDLIITNLSYLQQNHDLIYAVSQSHYLNFRETIREFMLSILTNDQHKVQTEHFLKENFPISEKYALEVFLSSIEGIISLWISSGTKETPEEMTNMILQTFNYDAWRL
ncbi:TetR/AcrR family transcriptional regulator [Streptococcus constellatus]|uniref:Transcriptional regulator, TetR family n=1 Tax=Streptococcus constellatus subsp. constellatus SK53 TaxID=1095730 RepID=A0AAD2SXI6_STRCV|nr:TetR/AcrR family transcriptional regulator [Streptococcus constellatus]EID21961.1 transcriptional regulator, TetR family [Streptococcus constellatus subsp. constellatus SK53]MDP1484577.1 TetR/AcrR family transcriptional regulator [Streptococcus constellatus]QQT06291.1 TetR/AcrR family transcriptional regulator [Streptococcus constellatus]SUN40877.1 putative transcriptional regulator [Streptococcus constellatus]BBD22957.1 putative transcriptional regulator [Streptococcus constellatus subsp. 